MDKNNKTMPTTTQSTINTPQAVSHTQESATREIVLQIYRFDGRNSRYSLVKVTAAPNDSLLDIFHKVKATTLPDFAYRYSCRHGICGSCAIRIDNIPVLACKARLRDYLRPGTTHLRIDPLAPQQVLRDLICDESSYRKSIETIIKPYIINFLGKNLCPPAATPPTKQPHRQIEQSIYAAASLQEILPDPDLLKNTEGCINCGICYYTCPAVVEGEFPGPAAAAKLFRFTVDSRDNCYSERLKLADQLLWNCVKCMKCVELCPRGLKPYYRIQDLLNSAYSNRLNEHSSDLSHAKGVEESIFLTGQLNDIYVGARTSIFTFIKMLPTGIKSVLKGNYNFFAIYKVKNKRSIRRLLKRGSKNEQ
ncbi:MAG: succinate dehydrogenase/fumarate reductase iron-sulfur subunit [Spirochaetales bacterium]|nr:succinate dehydrogenase/fumarate reductase iron-sulfur subunit [Spirochaetales bacterium]